MDSNYKGITGNNVVLFFISICYSYVMFMINPYLVIGFSDISNISYETIGQLSSPAFIISAIIPILLFYVSFKVKVVTLHRLTLLILLITLVLPISSKPDGVLGLAIILVVITVFRSSLIVHQTLSQTLHLEYFSGKSTNYLFSIATVSIGIGSVLGPLTGGHLYKNYGFESILLVSSLLLLAALFIYIMFFNDDKKTYKKEMNQSISLDRELVFHYISSSIGYCVIGSILTYVPLYFKYEILQADDISTYFVVYGLSSFFLLIPLNNLIDKHKLTNLQRVYLSFSGVLIGVTLFLISRGNELTLFISAVVISISSSLFTSSSLSMTATDFLDRGSKKNLLLYFNLLTGSVGMGLGLFIGVYIFDLESNKLVFLIWTTLVVISTLLFSINHIKRKSYV